ncbi:hypothetical protein M2275_008188 [Rhodococcus opacus]|nr:hypothetical protein [Rhodococcus opacus]
MNAEPSPTSSRIRAAAEDTDAGHRGQDSGKGVVIEHPFDVIADRFPLQKDFFQGVGELRKGDLGGLAAGHRHRLRFQCGADLGGEAGTHPGCAPAIVVSLRLRLRLPGIQPEGVVFAIPTSVPQNTA